MAAPSGPDPVIDPARMAALQENLGEDLAEVIETYLEDTPRQIGLIRTACQAADWPEVHRAAHSLKSSSGIFGARGLVSLCRAVETRAAEGGPVAIEQVEALAAAFERVAQALAGCLPSP